MRIRTGIYLRHCLWYKTQPTLTMVFMYIFITVHKEIRKNSFSLELNPSLMSSNQVAKN